MTDILQSMKENTAKKDSDRRPYVLDETLCILAMFAEGMKPKAVSALTDRSVNSLRYKFLEGEIELDGKRTIRSLKRFNDVKEIFAYFKVEYVSEADVKTRIQAYKASLVPATSVAS